MLIFLFALSLLGVNGVILEDASDDDGYGWKALKVWGDHYEAGYAHGYLLADDIIAGYEDVSSVLPSWGFSWYELRFAVNGYYSEIPDFINTEIEGIADGVRDSSGYSIDEIDILALNMIGDLAYLCRSISAWGSTTTDEHSTVTLRRLDYSDMGLDMVYHHIICMWDIEEQPAWINFSWPGYVTGVTGLNEYGIITSLHDWNSASGTVPDNSMGRTIASRYALTMFDNSDISWQADSVFNRLSEYPAGTGSFINFMAPDGYGGVIKCSRSAGYFALRRPHPDCYGGEILYTNNSNISGEEIGDPWYSYVTSNHDGNISMGGLWTASGASFHRLCVGYNGHGDMDIWFDAITPGGGTSIAFETTWDEFASMGIEEQVPENLSLNIFPNPFNSALNIASEDEVEIFDHNGRIIWRGKGIWRPDNLSSGIYVVSNGKERVKAVYLK